MSRFRETALALILPLAVAGCCAPDKCSVATSRFDRLEPVVVQLLAYEDRTAEFPARLEVAFPEGLPDGLEPVDGKAGLYLFAGEDGNHPTLPYRVEKAANGGRAATLSFSYVGGGGINHCDWTSLSRQWTCNGYM